jgi:uncharacterized protein YcbK (DUF882 family)
MIWKNLRYFTEKEKWGDADKMNPVLLLLLDNLRKKVGKPFVIHCGYEEGGHASGSRHYTGDAVDFHINGMSFPEAMDSLLKALHETDFFGKKAAEYVGLGIYPDWNTPGFHLDIRGYSARWGRIDGEYVSFEKAYKHAGGKAA